MSKKKKRSRAGSILLNIILIIAIAVFAVSGFKVAKYAWQTHQTNKTRAEVAAMVDTDTSAESEAEDPHEAMMKKYGEIYAKNKDFIGWLKVDGTAIDNPVMYTPNDGVDGQYYLRKNFYGEYDIGGTLFIDYRCKLDPNSSDGVSTNTIIYGHRMRNDTMFGPLRYFKDPEFCKEHTSIQFDTLYRPGHYKLFAAFLTQASSDKENYLNFIDADSAESLQSFLDNIKSFAIYYDEDSAPKYGDEFITLSTCDYYATDGRLAIMATRVD